MATTSLVIDAVNHMLDRRLTSYGMALPPNARRHVKKNPKERRDPDPAMMQLQKDVHAVVKRYRKSSEKPPFTMAQIIVMSAVLSHNWYDCRRGSQYSVSETKLIAEIDRRFRYYHNMQLPRLWPSWWDMRDNPASKHYWEPSTSEAKRTIVKQKRNEGPLSADEEAALRSEVDLLGEARRTLRLFDLPLSPSEESRNLYWRCDIEPIRAFLGDSIGRKRKQTFPLMRLPTELRLQIFQYVLQYPKAGLSFQGKGKRFRTQNAGCQQTISWLDDKYNPSLLFYTERPADMLALLLVSKAVFKEANPIFYQDNHFHADTPGQLFSLLSGCGARRRKYFTSISVDCSERYWVDSAETETAFGLLAGVVNLRYLGLHMSDLMWLLKEVPYMDKRGQHLNPGPMYDAGDKLALRDLANCSTHQIEFRGDCPLITAYLIERMSVPKNVEERMLELEREEMEKAAWKSAIRAKDKATAAWEDEVCRSLKLGKYAGRSGRTSKTA